ncbi:hypothetical protein PG993_011750 [Apiospora rasikravindrae]|uniref:Uncharacterized protein n=1 Tax=Apiospora rasikravindrae TaxID=990691 RepID=A0ABR1S0H5_9PEZI
MLCGLTSPRARCKQRHGCNEVMWQHPVSKSPGQEDALHLLRQNGIKQRHEQKEPMGEPGAAFGEGAE